jgi:hypothetical protein
MLLDLRLGVLHEPSTGRSLPGADRARQACERAGGLRRTGLIGVPRGGAVKALKSGSIEVSPVRAEACLPSEPGHVWIQVARTCCDRRAPVEPPGGSRATRRPSGAPDA